MIRPAAALVALTLCATVANAQSTSSPFAGRWQFDVTPTGGISMPSTKGTMTITQTADSLAAHIEWAGGAMPPRKLTGRARGDTVTLVQEAEGSASAQTYSTSVRSIMTWSLVRRGDALAGAITVEVIGMSVPIEPLPVRATRGDMPDAS